MIGSAVGPKTPSGIQPTTSIRLRYDQAHSYGAFLVRLLIVPPCLMMCVWNVNVMLCKIALLRFRVKFLDALVLLRIQYGHCSPAQGQQAKERLYATGSHPVAPVLASRGLFGPVKTRLCRKKAAKRFRVER